LNSADHRLYRATRARAHQQTRATNMRHALPPRADANLLVPRPACQRRTRSIFTPSRATARCAACYGGPSLTDAPSNAFQTFRTVCTPATTGSIYNRRTTWVRVTSIRQHAWFRLRCITLAPRTRTRAIPLRPLLLHVRGLFLLRATADHPAEVPPMPPTALLYRKDYATAYLHTCSERPPNPVADGCTRVALATIPALHLATIPPPTVVGRPDFATTTHTLLLPLPHHAPHHLHHTHYLNEHFLTGLPYSQYPTRTFGTGTAAIPQSRTQDFICHARSSVYRRER